MIAALGLFVKTHCLWKVLHKPSPSCFRLFKPQSPGACKFKVLAFETDQCFFWVPAIPSFSWAAGRHWWDGSKGKESKGKKMQSTFQTVILAWCHTVALVKEFDFVWYGLSSEGGESQPTLLTTQPAFPGPRVQGLLCPQAVYPAQPAVAASGICHRLALWSSNSVPKKLRKSVDPIWGLRKKGGLGQLQAPLSCFRQSDLL